MKSNIIKDSEKVAAATAPIQQQQQTKLQQPACLRNILAFVSLSGSLREQFDAEDHQSISSFLLSASTFLF